MLEITEHKRLHNKYKKLHHLAKVHGSEWLLEEPLTWRNRLLGISRTAVRNTPVLNRKVTEEFPDMKEAVSGKFLILMQPIVLSEPEDGDLDACLERRPPTTVLWRKVVRWLMTWSITYLRSTILLQVPQLANNNQQLPLSSLIFSHALYVAQSPWQIFSQGYRRHSRKWHHKCCRY